MIAVGLMLSMILGPAVEKKHDDTSMRVLRLAREPSDDRTGVFTSGIEST